MSRLLRIDYHVHERHSGDARESTINDYVLRAEELGIDEIAFTNHLLLSTPDIHVSIKLEEIPEYLDEISECQETTNLRILSGLEVDYIPRDERKIERILDEYNFDIILGSTHYVNDADIGSKRRSPAYFRGRTIAEAADEYYTEWKQAVETGLFDVMAHPDYWRKYMSQIHPKPPEWSDYGSIVLSALDSVVSYDVGLEVNTSGYRHGLSSSFPLQCFLNAAHDAGVKKVTIGSDSHIISQLGQHYEDAISQLKKAGFYRLSIYKCGDSSYVQI